MRINVVDAPPGFGKTSALINYINAAPTDTKFMFITPFLTEVERVISCCPARGFKQPSPFGTKLAGIKYLLGAGENIVSTHKMFSYFDEEVVALVEEQGYVLVMDEAYCVIEQIAITRQDYTIIRDGHTHVDENHLLIWDDGSYQGKFSEYKAMCDAKCVGCYGDSSLIWMFPVNVFTAFREIFVLTYMFSAQVQKYYYDYYDMQYDYLYVEGDSVDTYRLTTEPKEYKMPGLDDLIHICDLPRINDIGALRTALSMAWYRRNSGGAKMEELKRNCYNFFRNVSRTRSEYNLWTSFKDFHGELSGKGYGRGFVVSSARATNKYRDRYAVAYMVNKYLNPFVKIFLAANGIEFDEDSYALSEMLQFIWRSSIRDGKEIWVYIPSRRMRTLLKQWIREVSTETNIRTERLGGGDADE